MKLIEIIETLQSDADFMAYRLIYAGELARLQSVCDFNVFWLSELSPIILHRETVEFVLTNIRDFKRKLSIREFMDADFVIGNFTPKDMVEFKRIYSNYRKKKNIFNNIKLKINH
jgi:hypothetical protein